MAEHILLHTPCVFTHTHVRTHAGLEVEHNAEHVMADLRASLAALAAQPVPFQRLMAMLQSVNARGLGPAMRAVATGAYACTCCRCRFCCCCLPPTCLRARACVHTRKHAISCTQSYVRTHTHARACAHTSTNHKKQQRPCAHVCARPSLQARVCAALCLRPCAPWAWAACSCCRSRRRTQRSSACPQQVGTPSALPSLCRPPCASCAQTSCMPPAPESLVRLQRPNPSLTSCAQIPCCVPPAPQSLSAPACLLRPNLCFRSPPGCRAGTGCRAGAVVLGRASTCERTPLFR